VHVLYDHAIFTQQRVGGISRYFSEIVPRVASMPDARVSLFMGLHINEYGLPSHRKAFSHYAGWRRPPWHTYRPTAPINRWLFRRFARQTSEVEIYHPTSYRDLHPDFRGRRIVTVYDMIVERYPNLFQRVDAFNRNKREQLSGADGIICISEATRRDLIQCFGQPKGRVAVIHLASSLLAAPGRASPFQRPYLLYVGARGSYKNFRVLLDAYAGSRRLREAAHLVLFGGRRLTNEEESELERLGLSAAVHHVTGDDRLLASYYSNALAFIFPSLCEGFGMPLLEAMACGCPVVASDISCSREIAADAALFFDPASPEDLEAKVLCILSDQGLRRSLTEAGRYRNARFSWDRCARETMEFYGQVLNG
jgi:glycosyltransferase involved in cell wall biosynthesis